MPERPARWLTALRWALMAGAAGAILAYVALAIRRAGYPYQLEWLEGGPAEQVRRLLTGRPLYTAPSVDYVAYPYPPLYFWVSSLVARMTGAGFLPLRIVSAGASFASMGLLYRLVSRDGGGRVGGLVAAGIFAAGFRATGGFYDVARVDSLLIALFLAALLATARARSPVGFAGAGLVLCLAALTKQSALIAGAPIGIWLLMRRDGSRWDALAFATGALVPLAAVTVTLNAGSSGWFGDAVAGVLAGHSVDPQWWVGFWTRDLAPILLPAATLSAVAVWWAPARWGLYASAAGGMVLASYISRLHSASGENVLIPVVAAAALLCGLAFSAAESRSVRARAPVALACAAQLGLLAYSPGAQLPPARQTAQARRLVAFVRQLPGEVMVVSHPWEVTLAGKGDHAHEAAIIDWTRTTDLRARLTLQASIAEAVHAQRFSVLAFDGPGDYGGFPTDLAGSYRRVTAPEGLGPPGGDSLVTPHVGHPTEWWVARSLPSNPLDPAPG